MSSSRSSKRLALIGVAASLILWPLLAVFAGVGVRNGPEHHGRAVDCDVPESLRVRNTSGTDGRGLCVWASAQIAANYQNERRLKDIFAFMQTQPGSGWPERVDEMMARFAPDLKYLQYQGSSLDFIERGIRSGRPVCVTYNYGELYGNQTIAHMVVCVALNAQDAAILDNNDPGHIWWMPRDEFKRRFTWPSGVGWAWYTFAPPPPPPPRN